MASVSPVFSSVRGTVVDTKKYPEVIDQLASLRRAPPWELFFSDQLEQEYRHFLNPWYRDAILASTMVAALLLTTSHLLGWYLGIELTLSAQLLRLARQVKGQ